LHSHQNPERCGTIYCRAAEHKFREEINQCVSSRAISHLQLDLQQNTDGCEIFQEQRWPLSPSKLTASSSSFLRHPQPKERHHPKKSALSLTMFAISKTVPLFANCASVFVDFAWYLNFVRCLRAKPMKASSGLRYQLSPKMPCCKRRLKSTVIVFDRSWHPSLDRSRTHLKLFLWIMIFCFFKDRCVDHYRRLQRLDDERDARETATVLFHGFVLTPVMG
jgi:hypothetical protein